MLSKDSLSTFQRDLAARNVLLNHSLIAKVADFGHAARIYTLTTESIQIGSNLDTCAFRWSAIEVLENG